MKNIWNIYRRDLKSIVTNVMTAILVGGLVVLPSLYAWLNIKASWDPYAQTDQIPIGFVNEDKGAVVRDEAIHVGDDLEEKLRDNDSFSWHFVNKETAIDEVEYGNYFAVLVVPEDFSETLGSVITEKPEKAQIDYFVNEKINAIAPKITEKGASVIVEELSSEFIATVNGIIFEMFNDIGIELEENLPDIEQFETYVFTLEEELPAIHDTLTNMNDEATKVKEMIDKTNQRIPEVKTVVSEASSIINETIQFLDETEKAVKKGSAELTDKIASIEELFGNVSEWEAVLEGVNLDEEVNVSENIEVSVDELIVSIEQWAETLENIQKDLAEPNDNITMLLDDLATMKQELEHVQTQLEDINDLLASNGDFYNHLKEIMTELGQVDFAQLAHHYESNIEPVILEEIEKSNQSMLRASDMIAKVESAIPKVEQLLTTTSSKVREGQKIIEHILDQYPAIDSKVTELANKMRKVQSEADLHDIIQLLQNDPDAERGFFAEPVTLKTNEIFPIANYGTGMTPFYTVLSLWVGALLLISLLSPNVPESDQLKPREVYGGRLLTFMTVGILQTLIVTSGDIFIVGVTVSSKLWFILFGLLISLTFMTIVYTVVAIFGDVGKAVAIILLVLQIASSGGTYPVVLLPEFFQMVNPYLPFTYGVDLMREAVGGIIWRRALKDMLFLVGFMSVFIIAGTFLKGPVQARLSKLMKSKGGRLFH